MTTNERIQAIIHDLFGLESTHIAFAMKYEGTPHGDKNNLIAEVYRSASEVCKKHFEEE